MHDLDTIKKLNRPRAVASLRRRAVALNQPNGHSKDAEKGRITPAERIAFLKHLIRISGGVPRCNGCGKTGVPMNGGNYCVGCY